MTTRDQTFGRARDAVLAVEQAVQDMRSELIRKDAVIARLRAEREGMEPASERVETTTTMSTEEQTWSSQIAKGVFSPIDLQSFLVSPTCVEILNFVGDLNACARGKQCDVNLRRTSTADGPGGVDTALTRAMQLIDQTPPEELDPQRFGNKAFRKWHSKVCEALSTHPDEEFVAYFTRSFGDPHRLDYGTGHEAAFLFLMLALYKKGKDTSLLSHFLHVTFPRYLQVVRRIRLVYRLEPAGSHGVWSLDDYHFLPFVFGSSQLCGGHTRPKDILTSPTFSELTPDSDLLSDALLDILRSKKGPFREHSPLLHSLRNCLTWEDLNAGLMRMWKGEVLGKFPVAQHFVFGPSIPITWKIASSDEASSATFLPQVPTQTFDGANKANNDPLAKYFHMTIQSAVTVNDTPSAATAIPHSVGPEGNSIEIGGWHISGVGDSRISGEKELEALQNQHPAELDFPLPEMLFSKNFLRLEHSLVTIEFNVAEALRGCKFVAGEAPDRKMIKVPMADKWQQRKDPDGNIIKTWREDYDWTFTSRRLFTVTKKPTQEPAKMTRTPRRIDYEKLKQREAILWSKEVLLFEDDLFDLGISKLSVKIRVMPSCYFVLARFFLRVDGVHLRCIDSRMFHVFNTKYVLIENSEREAEISALLGGTAETKDLVDPNYVASILPLVGEPITFEVSLT